MQLVAACMLLMAIQTSISVDWEWEEFKMKYDKHYPPIKDEFRHLIYLENKARILDHNNLYTRGMTTFRMDINQFGDLTNQEFNSAMNGFRAKPPLNCNVYNPNVQHAEGFNKWNDGELPSAIDWRDWGYVTEVKNQGDCGCCWAFSATGSLEGQHFNQTKELISLSEQQLVDCTLSYGNAGCEGGTTDNALAYVTDNGGIDSEDSYTYTQRLGQCKYNAANAGGNCTGYVDLPCGEEASLQEAVATIGPISVAVDASEISFQFYTTGVYYEPECSSNILSHGMLVVGYGSENEDDYWLVKNSWGKSWGSQGYIKMARNRNNNCGIASAASYPTMM